MALRLPAAIPAVFAEALVRVFKKAMGFVSWKASRWYDSEGHRRCAVDAEAAEEVLTAFDASKWQALSRSEEHTSEFQSLMRISYAVFCLKKKKQQRPYQHNQ